MLINYPDTKGKFIEEVVVAAFKESFCIVFYAGSFYIYDNGYYRYQTKEEFLTLIKNNLPIGQQKHSNAETIYKSLSIERGIYIHNEDSRIEPKDWINFKNCLYNPFTGEIQEHTPKIIFFTQRPFNYNPDAEVDELTYSFFMNCVKGYEEEDKEKALELLFQTIGVTLSSIRPKNFVFVQGRKKDTGKSSFLGVIQKLLGDGTNGQPLNYSSVPIELMTEAGFSLSKMIGKPANICTETSNEPLKEAHINFLKKVTGGSNETVHIDIKGITAQEVVLKTFLIFAGNNMPEGWGKGNMDAFWDRLILIDFVGQLSDEEKIMDIVNKLDYEYIIIKAMEALDRFIQANYVFTIPSQVINHRKKLKNGNPVNGYLEDCDLTDSTYRIHAKTLYDIFQKWCSDNNCIVNISTTAFNKRLEENGIERADSKIRETEGLQSPRVGFYGIKPPKEYFDKYLSGWGSQQNKI